MRLRPGDGVLARHEDLVLLCEIPPGAEDNIRSMLEEVKVAAAAEQPGRYLVRHLVKTLAAWTEPLPSLCAFGAVEDGIAVVVHGNARLRVTMPDGELRLDGSDAVTVVDRVVSQPVISITGEIGEEIPGFCSWSELTSGVVRAGALQYGTPDEPEATAETDMMAAGDSAPPEESMVDSAPADAPADESTDESADAPADAAADESADELSGESAGESAGESGDAPQDEAAGEPRSAGRSQIVGVSCTRGHFNNPDDQYCAVCGIGLTQAGRRAAHNERPSLGVLVLDDGTSLPMTKNYVIGREPEVDSELSDSDVALVRLTDPMVSGVHAKIRLDGWEVSLVDAGSANGTFMREPGSDWCVQVPTNGRVVLRPGAIVTVGRRQFRYDSYRRP